ncbi:hypothetical protein [Robiginitalea aurantiaca]|uniref:Lipocalin-like domain-containing protein n=1 Tax=Robiginitalea aurantiaca TaxID=3056915 RepID=A0ABT7WIH9_9FLAO|nr:hypothetical protein [Robiginitalea aurantiaca]MDM9632693.1 hypothetical protein [Robiginitalea aurantiaca]
MKKNIKPFSLFLLGLALLFFSCREEEFELVEGPREEVLQANSTVATLLQRTATNDGSHDNIIDMASCLSVQLPITVIVNGQEINVDSEDDFDTIEDIFDALEDDDDSLEIEFPITVILKDYTEVLIFDADQLEDLTEDCSGENEPDEDIECADIKYPITASIFNSSNEVLDVITFTNDSDLYRFLDGLEDDDIVNLDFPITVVLFDGTEVLAADLDALERILDDASDDCDEDDDNDYDDDDCDSCTTDQLSEVLVGCPDWRVDRLERDDQNLEELYESYLFGFSEDGTLEVFSSTGTLEGTWEAEGSANEITLSINIPDLNDFNASWRVHEIEQEGDAREIDLRIGEDRLEFESICTSDSSGDDSAGDTTDGNGTMDLNSYLTEGSWSVSTYLDNGLDETSDFSAYTFVFEENGVVTADNGSTITGAWAIQESGDKLVLDFGTALPLDEFNDDWDVFLASDTRIELNDTSGGDGMTDTLILTKQ